MCIIETQPNKQASTQFVQWRQKQGSYTPRRKGCGVPRPMRRSSMDTQVNHSHGALLPCLWPLDSFLVSVSTLDCPRVTEDSDSLYTDAESNLKTILGEVEEESFLIYQAKGDTPGLCLERVRCSTPGNWIRAFTTVGLRWGAWQDYGVSRSWTPLILSQGTRGLWWSTLPVFFFFLPLKIFLI